MTILAYSEGAVTGGRCYYFIVFSYFKKNTFFIPFINTLTIADRYIGITTNSKSRGYGIFDLMLSTTAVALNSRSRFISGFVATEPGQRCHSQLLFDCWLLLYANRLKLDDDFGIF
jgi:hypothetical protein